MFVREQPGSPGDSESYRCCGASAETRFRLGAGGWRTDPSPGWLPPSAGGAPWARCSTGSTPPMPAPRWWAAHKTSAPPPETVPGARTGPATRRGPWERLSLGLHPRRFGWWILPWLQSRQAHPSLVYRRGHWCLLRTPVHLLRSPPAQLRVISAALLRRRCLTRYFRRDNFKVKARQSTMTK